VCKTTLARMARVGTWQVKNEFCVCSVEYVLIRHNVHRCVSDDSGTNGSSWCMAGPEYILYMFCRICSDTTMYIGMCPTTLARMARVGTWQVKNIFYICSVEYVLICHNIHRCVSDDSDTPKHESLQFLWSRKNVF